MNLLAFILIFTGGVVLTIGDLVMKKWVNSGTSIFYVLGLIVYMVAMVFLSQSYKYKNIAVASLMLVLFNIITLLIVSWFFYQEKLSLVQFIGVFFGLVSIVILELK
ncbi:MAG: hypothetical protein PHX34_03125 [Candidatus Shapirobacteria bacterium]|nr:hypothetical protein [Candidatus Shapirobacteria bacterium]